MAASDTPGTALCGRADLVRALAAGRPDQAARLAELLGFRGTAPAPETARAARPANRSAEPPAPVEVLGTSPAAVPFWHAVGYEPIDPEPPDQARPKPPPPRAKPDWPARPKEAPPYYWLAPWPQLLPRLRAGLLAEADSGAVDVAALVRRLCRGRLVTTLPRRRTKRLGLSLQVILDRSRHLTPYWQDQEQVLAGLTDLFPPRALDITVVSDLTYLHRGGTAALERPVPEGGAVLVLGDLGALQGADPRRLATWTSRGQALKAAGCRAVVLFPAPRGRCPPALRRWWHLVPWEPQRRDAAVGPEQRARRADRLIRLLSPAIRIEPGLLRAVRRSLDAADADAGTEADAWQHPAIENPSPVAASLDADAIPDLRAAFEREPAEVRKKALAALRQWRSRLPPEIWFEEILNLSPASRALLEEPTDLPAAEALFAWVAGWGETGAGAGEAAVSRLGWFGRFHDRAGMHAWADAAVGHDLKRLAWQLYQGDRGYIPPTDMDPAELPSPNDAVPDERLWLRQTADALHVSTAETNTEGSALGLLLSGNGLVKLQAGDRSSTLRPSAGAAARTAPLPQSGPFVLRSDRAALRFEPLTKPNWARAIGRDGFGLWTDVAVARVSGTGEPVIQRLRWMPPGRFRMGSPEDEPGRYDDEGPQHEVTLERGFWLFDTPCTQRLWTAVMGDNPSRFQSPDRPVESVSWQQVQTFLERINAQTQPSLGLNLPSEAQWEYACRAGTETALYTGPIEIRGEHNAPALHPIAWYRGNCGVDFDLGTGEDITDWKDRQFPEPKTGGTHPVGRKRPNAWGLFDMLGNVWERCGDHWHNSYTGAPQDGTAWIETDAEENASRVVRGGSWLAPARGVRCAVRLGVRPGLRFDARGFRCARVQV